MKYDEIDEMCRTAWMRNLTVYVFTWLEKKEGKYRTANENKNTYIKCIPEGEVFCFLKCYIHLNIEKIWKN